MIEFKSEQGDISVSGAVFSSITGMAATNCYGVKGICTSMRSGISSTSSSFAKFILVTVPSFFGLTIF